MKANSKKVVRRSQAQEIPVNESPSNKSGDRMAILACVGLLVLAAGLVAGGGYWGVTNLITDFTHQPINWINAGIMVGTIVASVLVARALVWLSVLGPILLSTRMGAWKSTELFATKGMAVARFYPGGSAWLTTALVQSLVTRGQYDEALTAAKAEWARSGEDERQAQNLGTLCFAAGVAHQAKSDLKGAQTWNDRAIVVLNKSIEQLNKPAKGIAAKVAATQTDQLLGQIRTQLAAAYFNSATIYFNNQDFRRAKEHYKQAVDNAVKSPEFPQKSEIIKFGNEQLGRLKHT